MTNRNLRQDIEDGRFRRDLFYRIGTIIINVPPLRERGRDIDLLVDHFNGTLSAKFDRERLEFDDTAMAAFRAYQWPGNVRELRNIVERLCLLHSGGKVTADDLPNEVTEPEASDFLYGRAPDPASSKMDLSSIESIAIQRAIDHENGNLTKVALSLGVSRPTLYRKIREYGLDRGK